MIVKGLLASAAAILTWLLATYQSHAAEPAGKTVYEKSCAGCHGTDGKGNPAMVKAMGEKGLNIVGKETKQRPDKELLKVIAEGAGKMPANKALSEQEQKQVLGYARSLAK